MKHNKPPISFFLFFSKLIYLPSRVILDLHSDTSKTQKPEFVFTYAQITQGKKTYQQTKKTNQATAKSRSKAEQNRKAKQR